MDGYYDPLPMPLSEDKNRDRQLPATLTIVDDDSEYREYLAQHLRQQGVRVRTYADGNRLLADPEPFGDESDWEFVDLARTSNGLVLTFEARGPSDHSLVFLFDRAGSVVEIAVHGRS